MFKDHRLACTKDDSFEKPTVLQHPFTMIVSGPTCSYNKSSFHNSGKIFGRYFYRIYVLCKMYDFLSLYTFSMWEDFSCQRSFVPFIKSSAANYKKNCVALQTVAAHVY